MSPMADALSAASLLLAALALVYSAWTPSIEAAINTTFGTGDTEVARQKAEIRSIRKYRAVPIAIACWLLVVAFVWRDVQIIVTAVTCLGPIGCHYDEIAAIFLLTQALLIGMALHAGHQIGRLSKKL